MNLTLTKVNGDHLFVPIATYWRASLINAASIHVASRLCCIHNILQCIVIYSVL